MTNQKDPIEQTVNWLCVLIAIAFAALIAYGLITDCEPSPGIYLKHCVAG